MHGHTSERKNSKNSEQCEVSRRTEESGYPSRLILEDHLVHPSRSKTRSFASRFRKEMKIEGTIDVGYPGAIDVVRLFSNFYTVWLGT
ncbi:hypothetical protein P5V15_013508 [Pogonomyrmex californicus]